jgi:hypothetical protein
MFAYELTVCDKRVIAVGFPGSTYSSRRAGRLSYEVRLTHT